VREGIEFYDTFLKEKLSFYAVKNPEEKWQ
jgi:hypothetical protein